MAPVTERDKKLLVSATSSKDDKFFAEKVEIFLPIFVFRAKFFFGAIFKRHLFFNIQVSGYHLLPRADRLQEDGGQHRVSSAQVSGQAEKAEGQDQGRSHSQHFPPFFSRHLKFYTFFLYVVHCFLAYVPYLIEVLGSYHTRDVENGIYNCLLRRMG